MDLRERLKDLVEKVPGAIGAILVDAEGESISLFSSELDNQVSDAESLRIRLIGALQRIWLTQCRKIAADTALGRLGYQVQTFSEAKVVGLPVNDDYALFLIGDCNLYPGLGIRHMKETVSLLEHEI